MKEMLACLFRRHRVGTYGWRRFRAFHTPLSTGLSTVLVEKIRSHAKYDAHKKARTRRASLKVELVVGTYAAHVTAHSHAEVTYSFCRRGGSCPTCRRENRRCLRRHLNGSSHIEEAR